MPRVTGFLEYERQLAPRRSVAERIRDFKEYEGLLSLDQFRNQAARCMDCGVPYCHCFGCPIANRIPDFNELIYRNLWFDALLLLQSANNFPEFTGRICPAPCEAACTLSINQEAVTIRQIERQLIEYGWEKGWINPEKATRQSGKRVAIVGSGPAGLTAAQQLKRYGHEVVVFEKSDRIGGLLRYGVPDYKLEKWVIDRRLAHLKEEGVSFETEVEIGIDISARYLRKMFDAIIVAVGATRPLDLNVPGRSLKGIHFAMTFLLQQNKLVAGDAIPDSEIISAKGKEVVIIGGGDTGADCVGTARRQGANSITQLELLPEPPRERPATEPWPIYPNILRTSSSHEEGCKRIWGVLTREFYGENKLVKKLKCTRLDWAEDRRNYREIPGSDFELKADLVLICIGFRPEHRMPLTKYFQLRRNERRGLIVSEDFHTNQAGIFAAGDCVSGPSLVVKAIMQGRRVAAGAHRYLSYSM